MSVYTNGLLLDEKRIEFFRKHHPRLLQISLYGASDDTYEQVTGKRVFHTVWQNILQANEAGLPIRIAITPSNYMKDRLQIMELAHQHGMVYTVNRALIEPRKETGKRLTEIEDDFESYLCLYRKNCSLHGFSLTRRNSSDLPEIGGDSALTEECGVDCRAGRCNFHIDWRGRMIPCNNFGDIQTEPLKVGFHTAWKQLHEQVMRLPRIAQCIGCAYEAICDKCPGYLYHMAGAGKQYMPWCEQVRRIYAEGINHLPNTGE